MTDRELARIHAAAMTLPRPWSATEIGALRLMPGSILASDPDGFALGRVAADEAELLTIAVRPAERGRGLGATLIAAYHAAARRKGACRSFLEVAETNGAARRLYARHGYELTGRRRGYYSEAQPPVDALVMARDL